MTSPRRTGTCPARARAGRDDVEHGRLAAADGQQQRGAAVGEGHLQGQRVVRVRGFGGFGRRAPGREIDAPIGLDRLPAPRRRQQSIAVGVKHGNLAPDLRSRAGERAPSSKGCTPASLPPARPPAWPRAHEGVGAGDLGQLHLPARARRRPRCIAQRAGHARPMVSAALAGGGSGGQRLRLRPRGARQRRWPRPAAGSSAGR